VGAITFPPEWVNPGHPKTLEGTCP
jgi:hypothetical protein